MSIEAECGHRLPLIGNAPGHAVCVVKVGAEGPAHRGPHIDANGTKWYPDTREEALDNWLIPEDKALDKIREAAAGKSRVIEVPQSPCTYCGHARAEHAPFRVKINGKLPCTVGDEEKYCGCEDYALPAEAVNHPAHYGGDTPYECIKVIEAWDLGFCLGSVLKYISRAGKKAGAEELEDMEKALWYINRRIQQIKTGQPDA
jgi:hypothetical protein